MAPARKRTKKAKPTTRRELLFLARGEDLATKEQRSELASGIADLLMPHVVAARKRLGLPPLV